MYTPCYYEQEVDSIFKNIRSVEKWLKGIVATVYSGAKVL